MENGHGFGNTADTITFLRPVNNATLLPPYEQLYIQTHHHKGMLIREQQNTELNPLLNLTTNSFNNTNIPGPSMPP
jgi:hypothetical protein